MRPVRRSSRRLRTSARGILARRRRGSRRRDSRANPRDRADLDTVGCVSNSAELGYSAQVDNHLRPLDAVLEPVETVEPPSHDPGIGSMLRKKLLRVSGGGLPTRIGAMGAIPDAVVGSHFASNLTSRRPRRTPRSACCRFDERARRI